MATTAYDVAVIGAGMTGAGVAVDAASRGLRVALVDAGDVAAGTSSKSSKMVHGGLRYLRQREFRLVAENLRERQRLLENAPYLVAPLPFLIPLFGHDGVAKRALARGYSTALRLYDLSGGWRIGHRYARVSRDEALAHLPSLDVVAPGRGLRLLRRARRRRARGAHPGAHRRGRLRRRRRHLRSGGGRRARGRARRRGRGRRPAGRAAPHGFRPKRGQRDRGLGRRGRRPGRRHSPSRDAGQGRARERVVTAPRLRRRRRPERARRPPVGLRRPVRRVALHLHRHDRYRLRRGRSTTRGPRATTSTTCSARSTRGRRPD